MSKNWKTVAINAAINEAYKSPVINKHGCVIVSSKTHKIISRGHNKYSNARGYVIKRVWKKHCGSTHAEESAMKKLSQRMLKGINTNSSASIIQCQKNTTINFECTLQYMSKNDK